MLIPKSYVNRISNDDIKDVNEYFKTEIQDIVKNIFSDKPMFNDNNFSFYFFDEYSLNTNTFEHPTATLYVEINQPENYKTVINKKTKQIKDDEVVVPNLHLTLKSIKEQIYQMAINYFDKNTLVWQEKFSVNFAHNAYDKDNNKNTYFFRIVPCLTYKNKNNVNGVLYYNDTENLIEIEYPKLSVLNFKMKDRLTNNLFSDYVVMFKNFFMKEKKEKQLPFEIFEILLYNVPNEMFIDLSLNSLLKITNYLRNFNIGNFITLDEQDNAFTSKYKSLSVIYAGHTLKKVSSFIKKHTKEI